MAVRRTGELDVGELVVADDVEVEVSDDEVAVSDDGDVAVLDDVLVELDVEVSDPRRDDGRLGHRRWRCAGRQRRVGVLGVDLDRQLLPLTDQFLLLLNVIDRRDGGRQRLQLVLRGIPLALVDELLHLGQLL